MRSKPVLSLGLCAALWVGGCDRASPPAGQGNAADAGAAAATSDEVPSSGPVATPVVAIDRTHAGEAAPAHGFTGPDGKPISLAAFRGRPVLVNLWATWCGPCVKELPTLDTLVAKGGIAVVALSQDGDAAKARAFLAARRFKALKGYTDPKMQWLGPVTTTLPTTILYDAKGREVWRVSGELDWTDKVATEALADA